MNTKNAMKYTLSAVIGLGTLAAACSRLEPVSTESNVKTLGTEQSLTSGAQIGLQPGEIALTLDDGPVPASLDVAKELARKNIPVTYFMIGSQVQVNPSVAQSIADLKFPNGQDATIIANHSWSHKRQNSDIVCIACDGTDYAIEEVMKTDKILTPMMKAHGRPAFFRAPGGNFFRAGFSEELASLAQLNKVANKYIGPVLWDVDGDVNPGPCQESAIACRDFYADQVRANAGHGIIILAHDIHARSQDMLLGNGFQGLVDMLQSEGFKFVAMDKYPNALKKFGGVIPGNAGNPTPPATGTPVPSTPSCTKENATGRILSDVVIKVTSKSGQTFDAQPFEEICPTTNVKNGAIEVFFPNPPAGFAFATASKVGFCNVPKLQACIKGNGGNIPCIKRECKAK